MTLQIQKEAGMDKLETDRNCGQLCGKLVGLTVIQSSFFVICTEWCNASETYQWQIQERSQRPPPRYLRVWMTAPPYLKVWIRQWLITWHNAVILPFTSNFTWYIANKATHCKQNEVHSLEKPPLTISHAAAWSYPHEWGERNSTYCNI